MPEKITSRKNQLILSVCALRDKKERDVRNLFITEGKKLYHEGTQAVGRAEYIFVRDDINLKITQKENVYTVTREVYDKMSCDTSPEGILCVWKKPEPRDTKEGFYLILEGLQDPGNVGTILRCACAFGADGVILCSCADPYGQKAVRAGMGAVFKEPIFIFDTIEEAVRFAKSKCKKIYAACLDSKAEALNKIALPRECAVMIGNEGKGLSDDAISLADSNIYIPMTNMESLNAAVAASVILYQALVL